MTNQVPCEKLRFEQRKQLPPAERGVICQPQCSAGCASWGDRQDGANVVGPEGLLSYGQACSDYEGNQWHIFMYCPKHKEARAQLFKEGERLYGKLMDGYKKERTDMLLPLEDKYLQLYRFTRELIDSNGGESCYIFNQFLFPNPKLPPRTRINLVRAFMRFWFKVGCFRVANGASVDPDGDRLMADGNVDGN